MTVHWTDTALAHLSAIHDYIALDSPQYARAVVDRLTSRSMQVADFPASGRAVPEYERDDIRELIEPPYRLVYRILRDRVDILAVIHAARELPPGRTD